MYISLTIVLLLKVENFRCTSLTFNCRLLFSLASSFALLLLLVLLFILVLFLLFLRARLVAHSLPSAVEALRSAIENVIHCREAFGQPKHHEQYC